MYLWKYQLIFNWPTPKHSKMCSRNTGFMRSQSPNKKEFYCLYFNLSWRKPGQECTKTVWTKHTASTRLQIVWVVCFSCTNPGHTVHSCMVDTICSQVLVFLSNCSCSLSLMFLFETEQLSCNDKQVQVKCKQSSQEEVHSSFSLVQNKQHGASAPEKAENTEQRFNPIFYPLNWSNPQLIACQAVLAWNRIYDETKSGGKHGWRLRKRDKMGDEAGDQLLRSHPGSRLILQSPSLIGCRMRERSTETHCESQLDNWEAIRASFFHTIHTLSKKQLALYTNVSCLWLILFSLFIHV